MFAASVAADVADADDDSVANRIVSFLSGKRLQINSMSKERLALYYIKHTNTPNLSHVRIVDVYVWQFLAIFLFCQIFSL